MEVMEDGNLIDKVNILIQRDMEYYTTHQTILQETICAGIIGGKLDFPRSASFASMKLVLWWEEEFIAAHKKPSGFLPENGDKSNKHSQNDDEGIVKDSDPTKFVSLIAKTADKLLVHLNVLTQEALDHADLTVLTGTIGAAALLKNCLWFYLKTAKDVKVNNMEEMQNSYKKYHEMCEALAERLLDLHCRLLSLYILQDAECLDWENERPFFESERGSYVIQMWWLYMQGTKEDLWNSVPPRMAQRVFSGMLNESLTLLTVRYTQSVPSEVRSQLIIVDISNLLMCVSELLPAICENAQEYLGFSYGTSGKILRDIHTKCQELLTCLLLRGSSIDILHKIFKKGLDNVEMFKSRSTGIAPWIIFALPHVFDKINKNGIKMSDLSPDVMTALELTVLMAQPQPNWSLLLKVLCMNKFKVLELILEWSSKNFLEPMQKPEEKNTICGAFLCNNDNSCKAESSKITFEPRNYYELISSSTQIVLSVGNTQDLAEILLPVITARPGWSNCLERRHVWNQLREPWYEAIINLTLPLVAIAGDTVINAVQTGATMYQAMSLIVACFSQFWNYTNPALYKIASILQESISTDIVPLNNSILIQILVCSLYTYLLKKSQYVKKEVSFEESQDREEVPESIPSIALAVAESLCSIDEDNKHTDQIDEFLEEIGEGGESDSNMSKRIEVNQHFAEVVVSDILIMPSGRKSLKVLYWFLKCNVDYFYQKLGLTTDDNFIEPTRFIPKPRLLLQTMFNIGSRPFDQLLSGGWQPNWLKLLKSSMGLSADRVWKHLALRWEFRNSSSVYVNNITSVLKQS